MRRAVVSVVVMVVVALGGVAAVAFTSTEPQLGLDLQGGLQVVLAPKGEASDDAMDKSVQIVRRRVDALGVAEPEIARQGQTIVVDLPGIEDQGRARDVIGTTAELQFRPVLDVLPGPNAELPEPGEAPPGEEPAGEEPAAGEPDGEGATATTVGDAGGEGATATTTGEERARGSQEAGQEGAGQEDGGQDGVQEDGGQEDGGGAGTAPTIPFDRPDEVSPEDPATFPGEDGELLYRLGPTEVPGQAVDSAQARINGVQWVVDVDFTGEGGEQWDAMAARYVGQQLAIVLDGTVISAPVIQQASFGGSAQISGEFSEREAKDLALVLRFGALPVELEEISVQDVSATLGRDQLRSGLTAGLIGLAAVVVYMLLYYRVLGVVVLLTLALTAAITYAVVAWLGEQIGLTLTMAGITGLIVSIGVAVDSNIVYFERLKDEVRTGRTVRSSIDRGFKRAFRTIVAADTVTLLGAAFLWVLAIGSVRGFAFFLGLATFLDLIVAYFFMHPLVMLLGRSRRLSRMGWFGVGPALGVDARPQDRRPQEVPA